MRYSNRQLAQARRFRQLGLTWEPQAGHYILDETGFCPKASPFQDRVYFILNYDFFVGRVGGLERFKQIMTWLPTWDDARQILRSLGVGDDRMARELAQRSSIERGEELATLYDLIETELESLNSRTSKKDSQSEFV